MIKIIKIILVYQINVDTYNYFLYLEKIVLNIIYLNCLTNLTKHEVYFKYSTKDIVVIVFDYLKQSKFHALLKVERIPFIDNFSILICQ